ncbi:hypothetical protein [Nocardia stercoris]|nr:hypothetical protein [Nocardia stercoris]
MFAVTLILLLTAAAWLGPRIASPHDPDAPRVSAELRAMAARHES